MLKKAYYHYFLNTMFCISNSFRKKLQSIQYAYDFIEKFYHLNNLNDSESLKALKFFRISTLSTIAYESCLTDYSVDFWKYRKLLPSILKHPKLDIVHQLSLIFRILKMKPLVKLIIKIQNLKGGYQITKGKPSMNRLKRNRCNKSICHYRVGYVSRLCPILRQMGNANRTNRQFLLLLVCNIEL